MVGMLTGKTIIVDPNAGLGERGRSEALAHPCLLLEEKGQNPDVLLFCDLSLKTWCHHSNSLAIRQLLIL